MNKEIKEVCNIPDEILSQLQKDVSDIKIALLGNDYNPTGGLLYRTSELEKVTVEIKSFVEKQIIDLKIDLEQQKNRFNRVFYTAIGVGTGIGFLWTIFSYLLEHFIRIAPK